MINDIAEVIFKDQRVRTEGNFRPIAEEDLYHRLAKEAFELLQNRDIRN